MNILAIQHNIDYITHKIRRETNLLSIYHNRLCTSSTTIKTTTFIISLREYSKEELLSVVAFLQNHVGHYTLSCYQIYPLSEVGCSISNMDRINEYLIFDKNL